MVRKTLIAGLVLALLGIAAAQIDCPVYHTVAYDNSTKIARCEPCPPNCSSCYWDQEAKKAQCTSCREKTFRNKDGGCSPCATGCEVCVGPGMSDCMVVSNSYFYDIQSKDIKKCAAGCASCDNKGNCVRCEQGYRHKNKVDSNAVIQTLDDNVLVDCIKCSDPKCNYCEVDALGTEFCAACQNEYGLNPKTKKCEPCPQGCLSCQSNNEICSFCKDGFQKVQGFPGCKPIDIPNCLNEDIENKKCIWCQSSFTPNAKNGGATCITCSVADPLCTHCREKTGNETSNNAMDLVCTGCPSRYTLNQDSGACEACSPHCTYCSSKGDCYSCDAGYQLKDNKCEKVEVPNCEVPSSDKGCASCLPHFYVDRTDENKCKPCHDSCLMCDGPGEDDCVSCSVDKYSLRVADENPFLDFFGSTKLRCVDKCPKEFNGKTYQEHELARECIAQTVEEAVPKSKYPFTRTQDNKSWTTIYHDSEDFFRDYLKHAKHSLDTSHHWARKHPKESAKYSSQCNFRGELVEKISASRETYYHCDCLKKYHGSNCEADHDLYEAVQKYALGAVKDMQDLEASFNEDQFSRTIINLCQTPLSMDTLSEVIKATNKLMSKQKHFKVHDVPQFLSVLDHLIQSFYKAKVELEHRSDGYQRDIGYQGFLKVMYSQFHTLINMGDMVFKESAGYQKNIVDASTHTFQVTDEVCNAKTFQEYNQLHVLSPNLLGLTELMVPATINIKNAYLAQNFQDTRMVIWSYSRHLFPPDKKYASHLVFMYPMHVTHHKATIVKPKWEEGDHVTVRFPIRVMPADVDVKKSLLCVALHFAADDHISAVSEGEMVLVGTYDENATHFVTCKFEKKLAGYYYSVVYMNDDIPHTHLAKTAKALAMDDNFHLQVTLEQKPTVSSSMVVFVKTALLALIGILLSS